MKYVIIILIFVLEYSHSYSQKTAEQYYINGLSSMSSKNYQGAIYPFKKALEVYPESSKDSISLTYWHLVECYFNLKQYTKAIYSCKTWIETGGPYLGNAYNELGWMYYWNGEYAKSIEAFRNAILKNWDTQKNNPVIISDLYKSIKTDYQKLGYDHSWVPESQFYKINIPHGYWQSQEKGKTCCIYDFAIRIENKLPISIKAVNIELEIKDKKGTIVYKRNHTAWVNGLNTNQVAQSDYFDLNNEVCLPCNYVSSEKFSWTCNITGVLY